MLNLHRDKKFVRREPGRDGKILCDHRQDGNDGVPSAISEMKEKKEKQKDNRAIQSGPVMFKEKSDVTLLILI